ncbi:MAG: PEP-CTERM sorting domain-containing protein [Pseudomonadota bacterium]|nr:PEP-CTERM sorting domain-containing protein [Pseudomonadota bacterium]
MKTSIFVAALSAAALVGASAQAATYNFQSGGIIGSNVGNPSASFFDVTATETLTAIAINTEAPPAPKLHQNNFGLGVNTGITDVNQLDNIGDDEAIVFDFGKIVSFDSITLNLAAQDDQYVIYGTNNPAVAACATGGLSCITTISTFIASGSGAGPLQDTVALLSGAFQYLIAAVFGGSGDGYRVAELSVSDVPLPAALPMMALGLGLFGVNGFFRRKQARA